VTEESHIFSPQVNEMLRFSQHDSIEDVGANGYSPSLDSLIKSGNDNKKRADKK
jgi:hypothetical protein